MAACQKLLLLPVLLRVIMWAVLGARLAFVSWALFHSPPVPTAMQRLPQQAATDFLPSFTLQFCYGLSGLVAIKFGGINRQRWLPVLAG